MRERTPIEEHAMAQTSALYTVQRHPGATVRDVMKTQGLVEIRAAKALADLVKAKKVVRVGDKHYLPNDVPR